MGHTYTFEKHGTCKLKCMSPESECMELNVCSEHIAIIIICLLIFLFGSIDTFIVIVSVLCLLLEINNRLMFLSLLRPIKLLRYYCVCACLCVCVCVCVCM